MKKIKYLILLFGFILMIPNAKAANFGYESSYFAFENIVNCNLSLSNCVKGSWSEFVEIGNSLTVPIGMPGGISRLNVRAYAKSGNLFRQDTYYTFSYRVNQKYISPYALNNVYVSDAYASTVQSLDSATRLDTSKISITITKESDTYYYLNLSLSPTTDFRVFEFVISFGDLSSGENLNLNADNATNTINLTTLSITYEADNSGAINNQTNVITNQTNSIINQQGQTNQKLDDLNDNLTDESAPNTDSLNDASGWLPPGPLDSLINLPLSLFNAISRDLSATCEPIVLPLPYVDKNLTLPCIASLYDKIGIQNFINWVGRFVSAFILFSYLLKLYKWVDDTLSFRENNHLDNWGGI